MTDTEDSKETPKAACKRRTWIIWPLVILLAIACTVVLFKAKPILLGKAPAPQVAAPNTDLKALSDRLAALEKENTALQERLSAMDSQQGMADAHEAVNTPGLAPEALTPIEERLNKVEAAVVNVSANNNAPQLQAQLQQLENEIKTLREHTGNDNHAVALLLAFNRLQELVTSGAPFREALAKVDFLAPPQNEIDAALDAIRPYDDGGVATSAILKEDFADVARRAMIAHSEPGKNAPWTQKLAANLSSLIVIRKTEDVERGDSDEAVIARAEAQLQENNLAEAVRELESLKGKPAEVFASWLEDARATITVTDAMEQLDQHIQELVGDPLHKPQIPAESAQ